MKNRPQLFRVLQMAHSLRAKEGVRCDYLVKQVAKSDGIGFNQLQSHIWTELEGPAPSRRRQEQFETRATVKV